MTDFSGLGLAQPLLRALNDADYKSPTPIQAQSIPALLEGRDVLGIAQTGTGKTAAFALPLLNRFAEAPRKSIPNRPQALILAPTRELAGQIADNVRLYSRHVKVRSSVIFGGASAQPQIRALRQGLHVLIATPGRLIDLMNQGHVHLDKVETFVLDEADRMLDMGFIHDVRRIAAKLPDDRRTVLFSATMPKPLQKLADGLLDNPLRVEIAPAATTAERIEQRVLFVAKAKKRDLLSDLMNDATIERAIVFTRTKHGADRVARHLHQGGVSADAIHGNKSQNQRQRALKGFRTGRTRVLVATDIAARGIDVEGVTHVINFDLPNEPESYVHRIGRTARAGAAGIAISFCDGEERGYLTSIEKTIKMSVPVFVDHPFHAEDVAAKVANDVDGNGGRNGGRNGRGSRNKHGRPHPSGGKPKGQRRRPRGGRGPGKEQNGQTPRKAA